MELDQIRAFLAVAQSKSFTRAAELLHVAQSTITTRIKLLEEHVGKPLFVRDSRRVELSGAGLTLQPYLQRVVDLLQEGESLTRLQGAFEERLVIGSLSSIWQLLLPPLVFQYRSLHPEVALRTITGHSEDIVRRMLDGLIDVGLVYLPPHHPDIEVVAIYRDSLQLIGAPDFRFEQESVTPEDLAHLPFVFMNWGSPFSEWYEAEVGTQFLSSLQVDDSALLLRCVQEIKGIGFLLGHVADELAARGIVQKLKFKSHAPIPTRTAYLIYPKRKMKSRAVQAWITLLEEQKHGLPQHEEPPRSH